MKGNRLNTVAVALLILASCKSGDNKSTALAVRPITVVTSIVEKRQSDSELSVSGNIEGQKTVNMGFLVAGKINYIAVAEGQLVNKGQLLSSLEPTNYAIGKEVADAQVQQVQDEYNRLKIMFERKSISESDFAKVENNLQLVKAQRKLQQKNLSDTKLYSPISGVLVKKNTEVGEIIGNGTQLFTLSDISTVKATAFIPENELHSIKIGQQATVLVSSLNETFSGKITEVGSAADPSSRAFTFKITIPNHKMRIRPGMIAEVKIKTSSQHDILAIPTEAVLKNLNNENIVYVTDKNKKMAFERKVSLGRLTGNYIEILAGLSSGETIITSGQNKLTDGAAIKLN